MEAVVVEVIPAAQDAVTPVARDVQVAEVAEVTRSSHDLFDDNAFLRMEFYIKELRNKIIHPVVNHNHRAVGGIKNGKIQHRP